MAFNYTARTPSSDQVVVNGAAPAGSDWKFMGFANTETNKPRPEEATLEGLLRLLGVPSVVYRPQYMTLDAITETLATEEVPVSFEMGAAGELDNVFLAGIQIQISDISGSPGVKAFRLTQELVCLGQRIAYT